MRRAWIAYNLEMWRWLIFLLLTAFAAAQTDDPTRLEFAIKSLPTARLGKRYEVGIKMGSPGPFVFTITRGGLPPGIVLRKTTGMIAGVPESTGAYHFTLRVEDEATRATAEREFVIDVAGPLLLEWIDFPKLSQNSISGSIKITNSSPRAEPFDLTVIIVAVNEIGKAFALGYQRFNLEQDMEQTIPFSSTVPNGRYIVHVDAIAEVAATNSIYRTRLQTTKPLVVSVNR